MYTEHIIDTNNKNASAGSRQPVEAKCTGEYKQMITQTETQDNRIIDSDPIQTAASRIADRHPHLANMAYAAATYAARDNGVVHLSETLVHVRNAEGTTYRLTCTPDDGWQCTCPAFSYRPAVINGHRYCKHIMAMAIQNRVNGGLQ